MNTQPLATLTVRAAVTQMPDKPVITAICVTYGRVKLLEHAIDCYLSQDYKGPSELLIFNTCPQQKLALPAVLKLPWAESSILVHNCDTRPDSLGNARNLAIESARGDLMITWDDDDIFLPNHLRNFAENLGDNDWIWLDRQFSAMGEEIKEASAGSCPLFAFRKSVWKQVGGYPSLSCGEDRVLISKISEKFKGQRVKIPTDKISFVYCWGNGAYHASGEGDDTPNKISVHRRIEADLQRRVRRGLEPTGAITLNPNLKINWAQKAKDFITVKAIQSPKDSVCIVELGRYGDIVNILPICRHVAENYKKPHLIVSKQFADLLDGVSYVEPYPVDLTHDRINEALEIARNEFGFVLQGQIWGTNFTLKRECDAFNRESWRMLGFKHQFENRNWAPWFDRRNPEREQAAIAKLMGNEPTLLVNVTSSHSSPFPKGPHVLAWIREHYGQKFHILDMAEVKLERIYDVIGLMERAQGLVSIDTALLHFAACCHVPTIAICNSKQWLGSAIRPCVNAYAVTDYDHAAASPERYLKPALDVIAEATMVANMTRMKTHLPRCFLPLTNPPKRTIFHVVERHPDNSAIHGEQERRNRARRTWDALYQQGVVPVHVWEYPRNAKQIGDRRALPYLKDILKVAMDKAQPQDIIVWTNDDNHLHSLLPSLLQFYVPVYDAVTSHRCEFNHKPVPAQDTNPMQIANASTHPHMGRDLFAATKQWLVDNWDKIPDFILGASEFDLCLACLVRVQKGYESTRRNLEDIIWPCELPRGFVSHEYHAPYWNRPENTDAAPSQRHNRGAFYDWAKVHLPSLKFSKKLTI